MRHRWTGWDGAKLTFVTPDGAMTIDADATVLALGGASWPRLGSDGAWTEPLGQAGVAVSPLRPSNMGVAIAWSEHVRKFAGTPLKRIALIFGGETVRGEAIITANGLEGGAVYALSAPLREALAASGEATLHLTLRPDMAADEVIRRLSAPRGKQSLSTFLRKSLHLTSAEIAVLHEAAVASGAALSTFARDALADLINAIPLPLIGIAPIARAISSAGGIPFRELDEHFMLRDRPGVFAAGEMLDWEAPTGGYLLQASFSTGAAAAQGALAWLSRA
jgi:uncharacterized flavoprotein (TIGR03862 family)